MAYTDYSQTQTNPNQTMVANQQQDDSKLKNVALLAALAAGLYGGNRYLQNKGGRGLIDLLQNNKKSSAVAKVVRAPQPRGLSEIADSDPGILELPYHPKLRLQNKYIGTGPTITTPPDMSKVPIITPYKSATAVAKPVTPKQINQIQNVKLPAGTDAKILKATDPS